MDFLSDFVNILLWTLWVFLFVAYLFVLFRIVVDVFRDSTTSGFVKAIWLIALLFLPLITALIYVIAKGKGMAERDVQAAAEMRAAQVEYAKGLVAEAGGSSGGSAAELKAAKELLDTGAISQEEFDRLKAKALA
jgi:hypothetical protein